MPERKKIVFRADGSKELGFGHLKRSSVLAGAFNKLGYDVHFVTQNPDAKVLQFFEDGKISFTPFDATDAYRTADEHLRVLERLDARVMILDSYRADDSLRMAIKDAGMVVIALDDVYRHYSNADIVVNHNPSADPACYGDFSGKLLAGGHYALIDPAFASAPPNSFDRETPEILVTMGGTDARNQTARILNLLNDIERDFRITILGGFYGGLPDTDGFNHSVTIVENTNDVPSIMQRCDAAITAGGVTCMELSCTGLPFLLLLTDDLQFDNALAYQRSGAGIFAGSVNDITDEVLLDALKLFLSAKKRWQAMARNGRRLIDGGGAKRTAMEIDNFLSRRS